MAHGTVAQPTLNIDTTYIITGEEIKNGPERRRRIARCKEELLLHLEAVTLHNVHSKKNLTSMWNLAFHLNEIGLMNAESVLQ